MKKILTVLIAVFALHMGVFADDLVKLYVDSEETVCPVAPVIKDGRTLVPLRAVFEAIGATVHWEDETMTVTAAKDSTIIILRIGDKMLTKIDGGVSETIILDVPAEIFNGSTLVPIRAVSEAFGLNVEWDGDIEAVMVYSEGFRIIYENMYDASGLLKRVDKAVVKDYISKGWITDSQLERTALDSGKCGENLTWTLYDDGLLKISGTGRSYDYCKGLFGDKATRKEIEEYQKALEGKTDLDSIAKYERGFQEGKVYDDENGQYVVPWYKYRQETDFTTYTTRAIYDRDNPNGWTYNRIEVEPGITYLGNWFFYRVCGPTELIIPETVTEIGQWSIRYSPTLKYVSLPDSLVSIEKRGCSRLEVVEEIRTGSGLKMLGDYAFAQNDMLKSMVVNGNIETMGTYSFGYNKLIEHVEFTGIKELPRAQFVDCHNLKEVVLPDTLEIIRGSALVNRGIERVTIPEM